VAFNPDGKRLAANGRWDCQTRVWDLPAAVPRLWPNEHQDGILGGAVAFLDNKTLAMGGQDADKGVVRLLQVTASELQQVHTFRGLDAKLESLAVSADGRLLAGAAPGDDPVVAVWDLRERNRQQPLYRLPGVHHGSVGSVAFSPSGDVLAYASVEPRGRFDGTEYLVRLWNVAGGSPRKLEPLPGHTAPVQAVAFAPNGQFLATADDEGRLILWDPNGGKNLQDWRLPGAITALVFAPDSRHLAVGNGNGTVYVLRLKAGPTRPASGK
jgi:WD40 repeat protein